MKLFKIFISILVIFCSSCEANDNEHAFKEFQKLLNDFKHADFVIKKIDDFYEIPQGVLIHERCLTEYRNIDVLKAVRDSVIQGMEHMLELAENKNGSAYQSHIPKLLDILTNHEIVEDAVFKNVQISKDVVCDRYRNHSLNEYMAIEDDCRFVSEIAYNQPKLLCQHEEFNYALLKKRNVDMGNPNTGVYRAYATYPDILRPSVITWNNKTRIYNYPHISFLDYIKPSTKEYFMTMFWHELFHNIGYSHYSKEPDYPYICSVTSFFEYYEEAFQEYGIDNSILDIVCNSFQKTLDQEVLLYFVRRVITNYDR